MPRELDAQDVQDAVDDLEAAIEASEQAHGEEETEVALAILTGGATIETFH